MGKLTTTRQQHVRNLLANQTATQGHVAICDGFGEGHQIRLGAIGLETKPFAGAAKAADDLVRDQKDVALVEDTLHFRPVSIRGHDHTASALHGLRNERRHAVLPELINLFLELAGRSDTKRLGIKIRALLKPVRLLDVMHIVETHGLLVHR